MNNITERLNGVSVTLKNIVFVVTTLATMCTSVYVTIDRTFEAKVNQLNANINQRISNLEEYTADQIMKNILKQADKIKKGNTEDIKQADVEDGLKYYKMLDEPIPENVRMAYQIMWEYYKDNY